MWTQSLEKAERRARELQEEAAITEARLQAEEEEWDRQLTRSLLECTLRRLKSVSTGADAKTKAASKRAQRSGMEQMMEELKDLATHGANVHHLVKAYEEARSIAAAENEAEREKAREAAASAAAQAQARADDCAANRAGMQAELEGMTAKLEEQAEKVCELHARYLVHACFVSPQSTS